MTLPAVGTTSIEVKFGSYQMQGEINILGDLNFRGALATLGQVMNRDRLSQPMTTWHVHKYENFNTRY